MTKVVLSFLFLSALAATAAAQPAAAAVTDAFLEQRAAEELASEGTILSRLGVALEVELVGTQAVVSLLDITTRRPIASTKVESLPADRDAAAAAVTVVAANLVAQLPHVAASSANSATADLRAALETERAARAAREDAEFRYREEALTFRDKHFYQGNRLLTGTMFLEVVDRHDLVASMRWRKPVTMVGIFGGTIVFIAGGGLRITGAGDEIKGEDGSTKKTLGAVMMVTGAVGVGVGLWAFLTVPFSDRDLSDMADQHNRKLRAKYGLPVSGRTSARAPARSLAVAPYATSGGGGLVLGGQF